MAENSSHNSGRPIVCYVSDRKALPAHHSASNILDRVLDKVRTTADAEADWIQIREKDLPTRELLNLVRAAIRIIEGMPRKPLVFVNDRIDIALGAGAAGAHLGRESAPVREAVRWCHAGNAPAEFLIGVSCHHIDEAREAEISGANYLFFGPVFDTPSKKSFGPPQGIEQLAQICRTIRIPVIAIGGVSEVNAAECIKAGAAGIAAIRLFQEPRDLMALRDSIAGLHRPAAAAPESSH
jgi:thiamine-phosphate pyrophosphorylase